MGIEVQSIKPFGAEVDLDVTKPLSDSERNELVKIFRREHLLVLRNQEFEMEDQQRLTSYLGPLLEENVDYVSNDPAVGLFGGQPLAFHSDLSFLPEPILVAVLYGLDVVADASSTYFASGAVAYASLPEELKRKIDGLQVLNVFPNDQKRRNRLDELGPSDPRCEHPLVQLDAVTGEPFLYLCEMQVDRLVGLPENEGEALIKQMLDIMLSDQCVYRHSWHANDCVVWDNLSVQHGRPDVEHAGSRTLRRTSSGTKGFLEQAPQYGYDPETGIVQAQA